MTAKKTSDVRFTVPAFTGARIGRPPKADIALAKNPGKVGRPIGDAARMAEFKARLMGTTGHRVIDKIIQVAMDDSHPAQSAMLKMIGERILPLGEFSKDPDAANKKDGLTVNFIMDSGTKTISTSGAALNKAAREADTDVVDVEFNIPVKDSDGD
jgi:hypothetical protein